MRAWLARVAGVFRGRRRDADLQQEIDTHLALLADELERRGITREDANVEARRAFGGVQRTRMAYREQLGFPIVDAFVQDVRFAVRMLTRERGFAITSILVLGLGIGVNNMMFTLIYGITMRGLPIPERDRVLHVSTVDRRFPDRPLTYPEFSELRDQARSFEGLAAYVTAPVALGDDGRAADRFEATYLTANAMTLVRTAPVLGRAFDDADDRPGAAAVAILGAAAWRARYAGDPSVLGLTVLVDGRPATVIGVMPDPSRFPSTAEVWLPLSRMPGLDPESTQNRQLRVFGRVAPGVAAADAQAEIERLFAAIVSRNPSGDERQARVVPINERFFFSPMQPGWLAFSTAGILIALVCCANAANLMLATGGRRTREIALRTSLGASRMRIVGQILVESLVIASAGGAIAMAVSIAGVRLFSSAIPSGAMPYWMHYSIDSRVLLALVVVTFLAVLIVGLVPAVHASRTDVNRALKDGGRTATHSSSRRLATAFLAAELAIAIVLAMQFTISWGGGVVLNSDPAVDTTAVLTAAVTLPSATYATAAQRSTFVRQLLERLPAVGGVTAASAATSVPYGGVVPQRLDVEGSGPVSPEEAATVSTVAVDTGYFAVFSLPLRLGRDFSTDDGRPGRESAIVNQRFVDVHVGGRDPIGVRLRLAPAAGTAASSPWLTIVGVAEDIRQRNAAAEPVVYTPLRAAVPATLSILLRSMLNPADATRLLRHEVMAIDPALPLYRIATMAKSIEDAQWNGRVSHRLITGLTLIAVLISIVGLYAVTAHSVNQRTQELGVRMALGARALNVCALILRRAAIQVALGMALGLGGSILWSSSFATERLELRVIELDAFLAVCALMVIVTLGACAVPLRRATRVDPVTALRDQ
jgi:putative ABC transport system permease protein